MQLPTNSSSRCLKLLGKRSVSGSYLAASCDFSPFFSIASIPAIQVGEVASDGSSKNEKGEGRNAGRETGF